MNIICNRLSDWQKTLVGSGTISVDSFNVATCTDGGPADSAYLRLEVRASGGSTVRFKFDARRVSGDPRAIIDTRRKDGSAIQIGAAVEKIISTEWQTYELVCAMPSNVASGAYFAVNFGVFSGEGGVGEITNPSITLENDAIGFPRCYGACLIRKISGVYSVSTAYVSAYIDTITEDVANKRLVVKISECLGSHPATNAYPIPVVTVAHPTVGFPYILQVGNYSPSLREYYIYFLNSTTGNIADIPATDFYISFVAIGV